MPYWSIVATQDVGGQQEGRREILLASDSPIPADRILQARCTPCENCPAARAWFDCSGLSLQSRTLCMWTRRNRDNLTRLVALRREKIKLMG